MYIHNYVSCVIQLDRVRSSVHNRLVHYFHTYIGVGSALLGKEAAMACTVAVESVIVEHYNKYAFMINVKTES